MKQQFSFGRRVVSGEEVKLQPSTRYSVRTGDYPFRVRKSLRHVVVNRGVGDRLNNYARVRFNAMSRKGTRG